MSGGGGGAAVPVSSAPAGSVLPPHPAAVVRVASEIQAAAEVTPEQRQLAEALRAAIGPLEGRAKEFVDDACLFRYLRARNWNVPKAEKMLRDTLRWRAAYKPEDIEWADVAKEAETGKMYRTSYTDLHGHPVVMMCPGRQNTSDHDGQIRFLVYTLEKAIEAIPSGTGLEKMTWLIDYKGWSLRKSPPMKTSLETLSILQNHYPERLAKAVCFDPPTIFNMFYKAVRPFVDPKTKEKIVFVGAKDKNMAQVMGDIFDLSKLEKSVGGTSNWEFDFARYSQQMLDEESGKDSTARSGDENNVIAANASGQFSTLAL
eukprot:jgi/Chlat1/814/Chrsp104S01313